MGLFLRRTCIVRISDVIRVNMLPLESVKLYLDVRLFVWLFPFARHITEVK